MLSARRRVDFSDYRSIASGQAKEQQEMKSQLGKEADDKNSIASQVLTQAQPQPQSQESEQNHGNNIDPPEEITTVSSQPLTRMLLASGGDMRALLLSDQPLSSFRAQTDDTGNEAAGQKIVSKDKDKDDEEEEVQEEEEHEKRFVRPPRLRFALSNEAASDGFPSAVALSLRWHPDHMQDRPEDAANLSIRAAFDTKFDEYYAFRHWRPSQGRWPSWSLLFKYTTF